MDRTQALKELKLIIEYKHLKLNAPGGVVVIPSFQDLRVWHGVIFVRKGPYQGGIFKFIITIPPEYNDYNIWPEVQFTSKVFNPYVDPKTGFLDVRVMFPQWDPSKHFMITLLTFIKKIFYLKEADVQDYRPAANPAALQLLTRDKAQFQNECSQCVGYSHETVYQNRDSPLTFSEFKPTHENVSRMLLETDGMTVRSGLEVLDACKRANDGERTK